ncbi:hypothetical protein [Hymenobacter cellulosilyticus]|uniref:Uncharacterized protein n=1 Tax=Hymenobacter cellulosilyticus TaxID=2932248 RepID=A0A8T9QFX4_9BACT|nr:hypothetical protein [Hymenobacter cellulosilyticus]UOQ74730.1 hypothetical protein MUN79_13140 [Hymenobacter cellulosilyticus]
MNELVRVGLLCVSLLLLLPACESACPNPDPTMKVDGINLILYSQQTGVLANRQMVQAKDLLLGLELVPPTAFVPQRGGFAAWADCISASPIFIGEVDSLVVTSSNDYDAQHPAGTSLNDLARIGTTALNDFLVSPREAKHINNQYVTLTAPPARAGNQQFQVRIHLVGGKAYKTTSSTVNLQP